MRRSKRNTKKSKSENKDTLQDLRWAITITERQIKRAETEATESWWLKQITVRKEKIAELELEIEDLDQRHTSADERLENLKANQAWLVKRVQRIENAGLLDKLGGLAARYKKLLADLEAAESDQETAEVHAKLRKLAKSLDD